MWLVAIGMLVGTHLALALVHLGPMFSQWLQVDRAELVVEEQFLGAVVRLLGG